MEDQKKKSEQQEWLKHVEEALRGLEFGEITLIVQDGVPVQLRRTDRVRIRGQRKDR